MEDFYLYVQPPSSEYKILVVEKGEYYYTLDIGKI